MLPNRDPGGLFLPPHKVHIHLCKCESSSLVPNSEKTFCIFWFCSLSTASCHLLPYLPIAEDLLQRQWRGGSQSMVPRQAASASPGCWLERQIRRSHPPSTKSGALGWVQQSGFTSPPGLLVFHQIWDAVLYREAWLIWSSNAATNLPQWALQLFPGLLLQGFAGFVSPQIVTFDIFKTLKLYQVLSTSRRQYQSQVNDNSNTPDLYISSPRKHLAAPWQYSMTIF